MSELNFDDFFKQVKKDRDDRLARTLIKQSELEEDLFWEEYEKENNNPAIKTSLHKSVNDGN